MTHNLTLIFQHAYIVQISLLNVSREYVYEDNEYGERMTGTSKAIKIEEDNSNRKAKSKYIF